MKKTKNLRRQISEMCASVNIMALGKTYVFSNLKHGTNYIIEQGRRYTLFAIDPGGKRIRGKIVRKQGRQL